DDDYLVQVMCSTSGRVSYDSDVTHNSYIWVDYGDVQAMTYRELAEIKRRHPRYLDEWLFILDDAVRTQLGQADDMFIEKKEIERIFDLPTSDMLQEIDKHKGSNIIYVVARTKCKTGQITDLTKIKALANKFRWDMEDFLES
ncbi:hypothetical protein U2I54_23180, partial [Bacillus pseudomycoides]|nr:hypothetical protein [Bacillus pseudomycoides]